MSIELTLLVSFFVCLFLGKVNYTHVSPQGFFTKFWFYIFEKSANFTSSFGVKQMVKNSVKFGFNIDNWNHTGTKKFNFIVLSFNVTILQDKFVLSLKVRCCWLLLVKMCKKVLGIDRQHDLFKKNCCSNQSIIHRHGFQTAVGFVWCWLACCCLLACLID